VGAEAWRVDHPRSRNMEKVKNGSASRRREEMSNANHVHL
jgi:hypothetical protein